MAGFSPAFGMLGTLVGLVYLLYSMSDISKIGPLMAVALVTTFYGVLFANLLFTPFAEKLSRRTDERVHLSRMIADGVLLLHSRQHPLIVGDTLGSHLPPADRIDPMTIIGGGGGA